MSCRYCTCADCSFTDTGAVRHPIGEASPEEANTIPRDQYELYKEAAEAWAERECGDDNYGWCSHCKRHGDSGGCEPSCKAARILGLKREE